MAALNPYSIIPFLTSASLVGLGRFCYRKNHHSPLHRRFFFLCLSAAPWPFALSVLLNLHDPLSIVFWSKLGHVTCTLAPAVLFDFVITLVGFDRLRWATRWVYAYAGITILAMTSTSFYFYPGAVIQYGWGPYTRGNWLSAIDATFASLVAIWAIGTLLVASRRAVKRRLVNEQSRLRYFALALGIFSFALIDYLPKFGVEIPPVGSLFLLSFGVMTTYGIIRHDILDFGVAIRKATVYSILAGVITGLYLVIVLVMEKWFQGFFGYRSFVATAVVGFVIAVGFGPLKNYIQVFVDRYFWRGSPAELAEQREQLLTEVRKGEQMKAVATLAAGLAHEIKNPLASIKTFTDYLEQRHADPAFREKFQKIVGGEVERINLIVQQLLEFAKPAPPKLRPLDVTRVIDDTLEFLNSELMAQRVTLERDYAAHPTILGDPQQLKQVFLNLILNSLQAMSGHGRLTVRTVIDRDELLVSVRDNGCGIAAKDLSHVFEPFFTTKPTGTGLGLAVVQGIIKEHGGRIAVESQPERGTSVTLSLPIAS